MSTYSDQYAPMSTYSTTMSTCTQYATMSTYSDQYATISNYSDQYATNTDLQWLEVVCDTTKFTCNNQGITLLIIILWSSWSVYLHRPVTTVHKHGTIINLTSVKRQAVTHPVEAPVSANWTTCAAIQALASVTVHVRAVLPLEAQHAVAGVVALQVCAVCSGVGHAEVLVTLINLRFTVWTCPEASQVKWNAA